MHVDLFLFVNRLLFVVCADIATILKKTQIRTGFHRHLFPRWLLTFSACRGVTPKNFFESRKKLCADIYLQNISLRSVAQSFPD